MNVKQTWKIGIGGLLVSLCILTTTAFAFISPNLLQSKSIMEERINRIMAGYDEKAIVLVNMKPIIEKDSALPGSPFVVDDVALRNVSGDVLIESIDVTIFTSIKDIPEEAKNLIELSTEGLGPKPTITLKTLPKGYAPPDTVSVQGIRTELSTWLGDTLQNSLFIAAGAGALILVIFLGLGFAFLRSAKKRLQAMESSVGSLVTAIQDSAPSAAPSGAGDFSRQQAATTQSSDSDKNLFEELTEESITAMLSDCYWCEADGYASFIWSRIPFQKKKSILEKIDFFDEYVNYLTQVPEQDLGLAQEPAYLSPLSIQLANNESITELVRNQPELINLLPSIRRDNLTLDAIERIELNRSSEDQDPPSRFPDTEKSPLRTLKRISRIKVSSVEEEQKLAEMSDLDLNTKENIPSLIWLDKLNEDEIEKVLRPFNARDLASAWIGPQPTLDRLMSVLPPRKKELLQSYVSKDEGSRESAAFLSIHSSAIAVLRAQDGQSPDGEETVSAA